MHLGSLSCRSATYFVHKLQIIYHSPILKIKLRRPTFCKSFHSTSNNSFKTTNARLLNEKVNVNIQNDLILYKNENNRDSIVLKLVFYGWVFCTTVLTLVSYDPKYITTWSEHKSWVEYIRANGKDLLFFTYSITLGPISAALLYFLNQRYIKYVILHKGGKKVSIITSHLYKRYNTLTMSINKVKVTIARDKMKSYLPLKVQGDKFYYILDGDGKFLNAELFDYTVGAVKHW